MLACVGCLAVHQTDNLPRIRPILCEEISLSKAIGTGFILIYRYFLCPGYECSHNSVVFVF